MLVVGFAATTCAQTGREIAQKVKDRPDGDTRRSEMVMTLINKRGAVRERKLISYSIESGNGKQFELYLVVEDEEPQGIDGHADVVVVLRQELGHIHG